MSDFANRLKQLRTENKITQKELGSYLNVTQNAIFNWENKKTEPSIETIEKIANYFNVNPAYLTGWSEHEYRLYKGYKENEILKKIEIKDDSGMLMVGDTIISDRKILKEFHELNILGKLEAIKRVTELKYIPGFTGEEIDPFN